MILNGNDSRPTQNGRAAMIGAGESARKSHDL